MKTSIYKIALYLSFLAISFLNFLRIDSGSHSASDTLRPFIFETIALALVFFILFKVFKK